ncbi:MAG: hypothetical protein WDW38_003539 [Sanguina aurantia]
MERPTGAGALGPRLIGRLTAELILRSPQYMSCVKMYELDLRGNKIGAIENLGATENQFDSIDLSDNAVVKLEGFPKLPRLQQLLLHNNRLSRVGKNLHESVPNLQILVLTNNRLTNLQDLDNLASLPKLAMLSLLGNPVVTKPNYRLYIISKLKQLRILDFRKVKQKERVAAAKLFPSEADAAQHGANTFDPNEGLQGVTEGLQQLEAPIESDSDDEADEAAAAAAAAAATATQKAVSAPTHDQLVAVKAAIANAQTLEEITRLEAALKSGMVPSQVLIASGFANGSAAQEAPPSAASAMEVG